MNSSNPPGRAFVQGPVETTAMLERFWGPHDQPPRIDAEGFFLELPPRIGHSEFRTPARLADLDDSPCLVLLGEPGMGKSTDLHATRKRRELDLDPSEVVIARDLAEFGEERQLVQQIFQGDAWDRWQRRQCSIRIELDSLDECRLAIPHVINILKGELSRLARVDDLKFRITCRTAAWPSSLGESLKERYDNQVEFRQIAPLSRTDAKILAQGWGVDDAESFLGQIIERRLGPLAARPITLRLLAARAQGREPLPESLAEIYRLGLLGLCREPDRSRREARRPVRLDPDRRYAVAARIAALMIFTNKATIWRDETHADRSEGDISIAELASGTELDSLASGFPVTEHDIREVLDDTGLFEARGTDRLAWSHRTFAEYLASHYLIHRQFGDEQIKSLLLAPIPPAKVIPPLHETAAWLAGGKPAIFRSLMAVDPAILLQSDVASTTADDRMKLVAALLDAAERGRFVDARFDLLPRYSKLAHPSIAGQIEPILLDKSANFAVRRLAIDIARECRVVEVQNQLVDLVLDATENFRVRQDAALATRFGADPAIRRRLRVLLDTDIDEDTEDELKGQVMKALWPDLLSVEDMFRFVSLPKKQNMAGSYQSFLYGELVEGLSDADLPTALKWVISKGNPLSFPHQMHIVFEAIVQRAWSHFDRNEVAELLVAIVSEWFEFHSDLWPISDRNSSGPFWSDDARRRNFVRLMLGTMTDKNQSEDKYHALNRINRVAYYFLKDDDGPWMLGQLDSEKEPRVRITLAQMVLEWYGYRGLRSGLIDPILEAIQHHPELDATFRDFLSPIELNSPKADIARRHYAENKRDREDRNEERLLDPPPRRRVVESLTRFEAGNPDAWWQLTLELTLLPTSVDFGDYYSSDLTSTPGWLEAEPSTRTRIIEAARLYLKQGCAKPEEWMFHEGTYYHPDAGAFKAMRLLHDQSPEGFAALDSAIWRKWIPAIIGYSSRSSSHPDNAQRPILARAYQFAPDEVLVWLDRWLIKQGQRDHPQVFPQIWADLPAPEIDKRLMERVRDRATGEWLTGVLLEDLFTRDVAEAREFVASLLKSADRKDQVQPDNSLIAAKSLLLHSSDAGWPILWPIFESHPEFGRRLVEKIAHQIDRLRNVPFLDRLTEAQLANFYLWLSRHIPPFETPAGFHAVGDAERIQWLLESTLRHLSRRATNQSLVAIESLIKELPEQSGLVYVRLEAEKLLLEQAWTPIRPADLLMMATSRQARFVAGGDQLLDVIRESLTRLQAKLQGETPLSFAIWDEQVKEDTKTADRFRPKGEERLSDLIKLHLEDDLGGRGIIINREVVIRSGVFGRPGQRTDIHIEAVIKRGERSELTKIKAIIEVKGCWNQEVKTAMKAQLVDRYIQNNDCRHGLYVVVWFSKDCWDKKDGRRAKTTKSPVKLKSDLAAQAANLSVGGVRVEAFVLDGSLT